MPDKVLKRYAVTGHRGSRAKRVTWDPPFDDANDVTIKAMCSRAAIEPLGGIPRAERRARLKKRRWSDVLDANTSSNAYELSPADIGY